MALQTLAVSFGLVPLTSKVSLLLNTDVMKSDKAAGWVNL